MKHLNNIEVRTLVRCTYSAIGSANSSAELVEIVDGNEHLDKNRFKQTKYPKLEFNLTVLDIQALRTANLLDDDGKIISANIRADTLSPLEKLLYSIVWKNGDLGKENHIVAGVESTESNVVLRNPNKSQIFFQLGRHLADREEPIVDQHVIRAFAIRCSPEKDIPRERKQTSVSFERIRQYKEWQESDFFSRGLKQDQTYKYFLDQVLFALGKAIKTK
jgi:hypothetical protein